MYKPEDMDISPTLNEFNKMLSHKVLKNYVDIYRASRLRSTNEEELRKFQAYTYGILSLIDQVGEILAALRSLRLEKDTMVIFTSDHGDLMGDHGMLLKGPAHYQGVIKIPLIWKVPGLTKPGVSSSITNTVDIASTILNLFEGKVTTPWNARV